MTHENKCQDIEPYISREEISKRIKELGSEISKDYGDEQIVVIGVLNGSFLFCADLIREISSPVLVEFMGASSYGDAFESSGNLDITLDLKRSIEGKNVLIVEDIVDTGLTLTALIENLKLRSPKSLKVCSLLHKPAKTVHQVNIDYLAFEIEDKFVVGYGLDLLGLCRELPFIGVYRGKI